MKPPITTGPLSLKLLDEAYWKIVYGYQEPDVLKCSAAMKDMLIELKWDRLNKTVVKVDASLDDQTIIITYSKALPHFEAAGLPTSIVKLT